MDLHRLFTEHPASVGETYRGHLLRAAWFSSRLAGAAVVCFLHALFPFLFVRTGSQIISQLHIAMVTHRRVVPQEVDLAAQGQLRAVK